MVFGDVHIMHMHLRYEVPSTRCVARDTIEWTHSVDFSVQRHHIDLLCRNR